MVRPILYGGRGDADLYPLTIRRMSKVDEEDEGLVGEVTNEQLMVVLRAMERDVQRLDATIRGNNGEGLVTKVAVLRRDVDTHGAAVGRAHARVDGVEVQVIGLNRRIVFFTGGVATLGALFGTMCSAVVQHFVSKVLGGG